MAWFALADDGNNLPTPPVPVAVTAAETPLPCFLMDQACPTGAERAGCCAAPDFAGCFIAHVLTLAVAVLPVVVPLSWLPLPPLLLLPSPAAVPFPGRRDCQIHC